MFEEKPVAGAIAFVSIRGKLSLCWPGSFLLYPTARFSMISFVNIGAV
jgi:hypothetical protein